MKEKKKISSELKSKLLEAGFLPQINEEYYFKSYFRSAIFAYPDDMIYEEGRTLLKMSDLHRFEAI